ncbi:XrtA system polysaccharide chain length determinant [Thiohalospira sp.]|uniref:XrtA system polysaccharide chain length determinant n=1 Tax=Thiohalospira sp. TaxID=3080549 RepID=UPI003980B80E
MMFSFEEQLRILIREIYQRRVLITTLFVAITLAAVAVGLVMPQRYTTSADIMVDNRNIIEPLMEGTAFATDVSDRARVARELLFGERILREVFQQSGLQEVGMTPREEDRRMKELREATRVSSHGDKLIRITYRDSDPHRVQRVTELFVELFVEESRESKQEESRQAFRFIEQQVQEYHDKLVEVEEKIKEFRSENLGARGGSESSVNSRINELTSRIERTEMELKEAEVREESLQKQLSGQAAITASLTREGRFQNQMAELQQRRDELLLQYTESHPDVRRVEGQIASLEQATDEERKGRQLAESAGASSDGDFVDEDVSLNPLYQELRSDLSEIRTHIDTLETRLAESEKQLEREIARGQQIHESEAVLSELNRDYDVNQEIYQDLLRRRENARVSMNMDQQGQGLSFRIEEPPRLPREPEGVRLIHVAGAGLVAGVGLPLGLVVLLVRFDPRVRAAGALSRSLPVPVTVTVPHLATPGDRRQRRWISIVLLLVLVLWAGLFGGAGVGRIAGVI